MVRARRPREYRSAEEPRAEVRHQLFPGRSDRYRERTENGSELRFRGKVAGLGAEQLPTSRIVRCGRSGSSLSMTSSQHAAGSQVGTYSSRTPRQEPGCTVAGNGLARAHRADYRV